MELASEGDRIKESCHFLLITAVNTDNLNQKLLIVRP